MEPMSSSANTSALSPSEYLAIERHAETKSEYINGQMYAMSGAKFVHSLICSNLVAAIGTQLRGQPCKVVSQDQRVKVEASTMYTYPDVVAVCEEPRFEDTVFDTLLNPTLIIEVLSPTTEKYDRGEKFDYYSRIESLREYVLVSSDQMRVERFTRNGTSWSYLALAAPEATLELTSIACRTELSRIYEGVELPPPREATAAAQRTR